MQVFHLHPQETHQTAASRPEFRTGNRGGGRDLERTFKVIQFLIVWSSSCCIARACSHAANAAGLPLGCAVALYTRTAALSAENAAAAAAANCFVSAPDSACSHQQLFPFQDCKWKMYIELDGDEIAITYIKDVVFNANRADVETLRMTKVPEPQQQATCLWFFHSFSEFLMSVCVFVLQPPFVMDKWITGIQPNQRVDYTVTYEVRGRSHWLLPLGHV